MSDLQSELTGTFETLIVALLDTSTMYDVKCLKNAVKVRTCTCMWLYGCARTPSSVWKLVVGLIFIYFFLPRVQEHVKMFWFVSWVQELAMRFTRSIRPTRRVWDSFLIFCIGASYRLQCWLCINGFKDQGLAWIKIVYVLEYGNSLEDDVTGDTGGAFRQMLVVLLQVMLWVSCVCVWVRCI